MSNSVNWWRKRLVVVGLLCLTACSSLEPMKPVDNRYGKTSVISGQFPHFAVEKTAPDKRLHVYIEGDGEPFEHRIFVTRDPGPRYPLLLDLMQMDQHPSLFLGRPCYFTQNIPAINMTGCNKSYWTSARYSEEVIASMTAALRVYLLEHPASGITLIGYSGGGAIAMLMAVRMQEVDQLVTLSGSLNTQAWTKYHGYIPLFKSLNPAESITTASPKRQLHYGGGRDDNIPPALATDFLASIGQSYIVYPQADHDCCWHWYWKEILQQIDQQMQPILPPQALPKTP